MNPFFIHSSKWRVLAQVNSCKHCFWYTVYGGIWLSDVGYCDFLICMPHSMITTFKCCSNRESYSLHSDDRTHTPCWQRMCWETGHSFFMYLSYFLTLVCFCLSMQKTLTNAVCLCLFIWKDYIDWTKQGSIIFEYVSASPAQCVGHCELGVQSM